MTTFLIIYLAFGIGISISSKTNIMANERWYLQLLYVVAYPVIIYITAIKTARLAVKLTEMMDEQTKVEVKTKGYAFLEEPEVPGTRKDGHIFLGIPETAYIIRPEDVGLVRKSLKEYLTQDPSVHGKLITAKEIKTIYKLIEDMEAPSFQCRSFATEQTEPKCGQDMLESYAFDRLLYDHRKGSDDKATAEEIQKFIRTYFSPYKSRS